MQQEVWQLSSRQGPREMRIETLYWMGGKAGIDLKALAHERHSREFCAECADAQPCAKKSDSYNSLIINTSYFTDTSAQGCASAHSAQNSIVEEVTFHHTFSDKIAEEDWPSYFCLLLDSMGEIEEEQGGRQGGRQVYHG